MSTSNTIAQRQIDEWFNSDHTFSLYIEDDPDITELPIIPSIVSHVYIRNCHKLVHIHNLPESLKHLQIADCPLLETLPYTMPPKLYYIDIQTETCISICPRFTESLEYLIINHAKKLLHIEILPSSVNYIYIRNTPIRTLPVQLPMNLFTLVVSDSHLIHLPLLPDSLDALEISSPYLETLPPFSCSLRTIRIRNTPINTLPELPLLLYELDVGNTQLSVIPPLPAGTKHLYVDSTRVTELPELPPNLTMLSCAHTNIRRLPRLPEKLNILNLSYTLINYLRADDFANTSVYQMQTHAYTCDRFPKFVKYMHFSHPDFQILDLPPLYDTTITFNYEDEPTSIDPVHDIGKYTLLKHKERKKQIARVTARVRLYKEELMINTWHPRRVETWCGVRFDTIDD